MKSAHPCAATRLPRLTMRLWMRGGGFVPQRVRQTGEVSAEVLSQGGEADGDLDWSTAPILALAASASLGRSVRKARNGDATSMVGPVRRMRPKQGSDRLIGPVGRGRCVRVIVEHGVQLRQFPPADRAAYVKRGSPCVGFASPETIKPKLPRV